ncbi:MAG: hypothetical protein ACYSW8_25790 [Planctomycetota bacterium]|jgi:hypothetical protein
MSALLEAFQTLLDNGLPEGAIVPIINDLFESDAFEDEDDKKLCVLLAVRADRESDVDCDISEVSYDCCQFEVAGNIYLVVDEDEREERWEDALENLLDDCIEGADGPYFDREAWKRDARFDGAASYLSSYDGSEEEYGCGGSWFWVYRNG